MAYSKQKNYSRRNKNYRSYHSRQRRFSPQGKKLDESLFVKKAKEATAEKPFAKGANFTDYGLVDKLKANIAQHGYQTPTQIQNQVIPQVLAGKDIIGVANTGTGKTAAFLTGLINKTYLNRQQKTLIIVPTRELALQISQEFEHLARGMNLAITTIIGGVNINRQINSLKSDPNFIAGTPGRLKDLIKRGKIKPASFQNVVLDEVDRMVDMGFIKDIKYLMSLLPQNRQGLFFSATVDNRTEQVLQNFAHQPIRISVKRQDTLDNVEQDIIKITNRGAKIDVLRKLLAQPGFDKVLIFGRTKWGMEKLARLLSQYGIKATAIHGNKSQNQRQRALEQFKNNQIQVLTATDVASRGLDIDNVTQVINYDAPATYDDYIHRIGRTGRMGKKGLALTFVE
ncbi:MAG: DEAD/DEAH box helicase-like protein [Microgenomates bacterium 39_6]|nr:MAG: DEAD/DEAH box helicase-like protein [Microgenomates bacterium 39_6]